MKHLDENIFAAAGNSLFVTTDQGNSFSEIISLDVGISDINFINKQLWYVAGYNSVYKPTDGGANWEVDLDLDSLQSSIVKLIKTENYLYVLNLKGSVFKKSVTI